MMGPMAEASAQVDTGKSTRNWERDSTRREILEAARRLAAREGAETISLSRVAAEAGFAPPAVYAYFVSKDDLHLAVVADDLAKLARAMRGDASAPDESDLPADDMAAEDMADAAAPADVIALRPEQAGEDGTGATAYQDEEPGEQAPALVPDEFDGAPETLSDNEADAVAADVQAKDTGAVEASSAAQDAQAPAETGISLLEIEQAIGVVLASPDDFVESVPPGEEVPDAFPEENSPARLRAAVDDDGAGRRRRRRDRGGRAGLRSGRPAHRRTPRQSRSPAHSLASAPFP